MTVMQPDDMSGSISEEDFLTFNFEKLAAMGDRDFVFYKPNPMFVGPMLPTVLFTDKLDGSDMRHLQPSLIIFDEAHHEEEFEPGKYRRLLDEHLGANFAKGMSDLDIHEVWKQARYQLAQPDYGKEVFIRDSYKMRHDSGMFLFGDTMSYWKPPAKPQHKPGEQPRGTKPLKIGGIKKSKQQRAAIKARRKQR